MVYDSSLLDDLPESGCLLHGAAPQGHGGGLFLDKSLGSNLSILESIIKTLLKLLSFELDSPSRVLEVTICKVRGLINDASTEGQGMVRDVGPPATHCLGTALEVVCYPCGIY